MPKLPDNYVKAPRFDNPLRSTADHVAEVVDVEHKLVLRFDETRWDALHRASLRDGSTPEALIQRALDRFLAEPVRVVMAAASGDDERPNTRAQLIDELRAQFGRRSWVQCFLTLRALAREVRA